MIAQQPTHAQMTFSIKSCKCVSFSLTEIGKMNKNEIPPDKFNFNFNFNFKVDENTKTDTKSSRR